MIRLKYLTYCLLGISLSACTQHVIKTNPAHKSLDQQVVSGLNAMYDYPSYDYSGQFNIQVDSLNPAAQHNQKTAHAALDADVQKKIDQFLANQKIKLSAQDKQALYTAIATQKDSAGLGSSRSEKMAETLLNILNDLQFKYDGSIHYRERIGSFNLTARYEKPTLLVQAKVPMILDFKDYRFYTNYFAVMPYLVNRDSQDSLAYIDFSKYSDQFKNVDVKKFAEYLKASTAVSYTLAKPEQFQRLSLSKADQAKGVVEKVRLNTTIEALLLQASMFEQVNQKYFTQSILGIQQNALEKWAEDKATAVQTQHKDSENVLAPEDQANAAALTLYTLLNQKLNLQDTDASEEEVAHAEPESVQDQSDTVAENGLSAQDCEALRASNQSIAVGDVTSCLQQNGIDILSKPQQNGLISLLAIKSQLAKTFAQYDQNQFVDDKTFKTLWLKHLPEIEQALAAQKTMNPMTMDVGLDAQGRAVTIDYGATYVLESSHKKLNFHADTFIQNYGHATPIDTKQLKQAKSLKEVSKGSMIEGLIGNLSKSLGQQDSVLNSSKLSALPWKDQLNQLAEHTYDQTRSYEKTFNAVFIAKLSAESPEYVKRYSPHDLNEIGRVYAYWYADEKINTIDAKGLVVIEKLQQKHKLQYEDQFDDELGYEVDRMVMQAMQTKEERQHWNTLKQKLKSQPQHLFAQQYVYLFNKDNQLDAVQRKQLAQTATLLGRVFVDARHGKLTETSLQGIQQEHLEYIDYDLFKQVYVQVLNQ